MKRNDILRHLKQALQRYAMDSYSRFVSLDGSKIQEIHGAPSDSPDADYCVTEVEVLDRWNSGPVDVLHVAVTVNDGFQTFVGAVFFQSDGKVRVSSEICTVVDGVAEPIQE